MFLLHVTYMIYVKCAVLTEFGQLLRLQTHFTVSSVHSLFPVHGPAHDTICQPISDLFCWIIGPLFIR